MTFAKLLDGILAWIGAKGFLLYVACLFLFMVPSGSLWFRDSWTINGREFDFWVGQIQGGPFVSQRVWELLGTVLPGLLFLIGGLGFWASVRTMELSGECGRRTAAKIALILAIFCLGIPWFSVDCYFYLAKGWQEAGYGMDVYRTTVTEIPGFAEDPFFKNVHIGFLRQPGNYGPLFQYFSKSVATVSGGNFEAALLLLRLYFLAAFLLAAWVVVDVAKQQKLVPAVTAYVFLCNPLIGFNLVTALHNDAGSNLGMLLAVWLALRRMPFLSGVMLGLGAAWKFMPLLLFPVLTLYFLRFEGRWRFGWAASFLVGLGLVFVSSFVLYPASFSFFTEVTSTAGLLAVRSSLAMIMMLFLAPFGLEDGGYGMAKLISTLLFMGASAWLLWPYLRGNRVMTREALPFVTMVVLLLYVLVGSTQVEEWYMTWILCFGLMVNDGKVRFFCLFLSVFYMPWVNLMCEKSTLTILLSQTLAYAVVTVVAGRVLLQVCFVDREWRNRMLGPVVRL